MHARSAYPIIVATLLTGAALGCTEDGPLGPAGEAAVAPAQMTAVAVVRPFRDVSSGTLWMTGSCAGGAGASFAAAGTGNDTHLGRVDMELAWCLNLVTFAITDGTATITAANGDELHLTFTGGVLPSGELSSTYTIVGGTGRFVDAEGEATGSTTADMTAGTWTSTATGWIAY